MASHSLRRTASFVLWGALFCALVLVLLKFQGIIGRTEHHPEDVSVDGVPIGQLASGVEGARHVTVERERAPTLEFHSARIEAVDLARIAARVMAVVEEVSVREGDEVQEGALIVRLDAKDAQARRAQTLASVEAATARVTAAEAAHTRAAKLNADGNLSPQALEGARAERDAARAFEAAAREGLAEAENALGWHHITAPFAGRVLARTIERGDLAQPGQTLASLYRADALRVEAAIPARLLERVAVGETVTLDFQGAEMFSLPITRVLPETDPATGTVTVHVDVPRELARLGVLRPGSLGRAGVSTGSRERLVLPDAAIERIGQVERAWLVYEGHARPVNVRTVPVAPLAGGEPRVEVLFGLNEGDAVLAR